MLMGKIVAHFLVRTAVSYLRTEAVSAIIFITYTVYGLRMLQKVGHLRTLSNLQFEKLIALHSIEHTSTMQ
jgi:hypothetical protein